MGYTITKLDKRHSGKAWFKYYVSSTNQSWPMAEKWAIQREFLEWQRWCWETYGQGTERDWTHLIKDTARWGWETQHSTVPRLYLKGDQELMLFKLRWT